MYNKAYGLIETYSPLHVGASAGEERGNLNLIFRDQFTQTGIIPGSSIRGRLRSEMRLINGQENKWFGQKAKNESGKSIETTESLIKIEYASIVWIPVFCPGQPIVWVSSPALLKRYQRIAGGFITHQGKKLSDQKIPESYIGSSCVRTREVDKRKKMFFNFGFVDLKKTEDLSIWFPDQVEKPALVINDNEIGLVHDMALYRQSRVALKEDEKKNDDKGFFNVEALPEGTILVFPIAIKNEPKGEKWKPFNDDKSAEIYLGGLESIGFGHCLLTLAGI